MNIQQPYSLVAICVLMLFVSHQSKAQQNYVPNCSFEINTGCPISVSEMFRTDWRQYTAATSDYFNTCASPTLSSVSIPNNGFGYQYAAHGEAYVGVYTYVPVHQAIYKEYVARTITPLIKGAVYEVSMSVSLSNVSEYGTNDLGVYFYDNGPIMQGTAAVLDVKPQVSYSKYGVIMDTMNWVRVTNYFAADSVYDNIVIGGFTEYDSLGLDSFTITRNNPYAYYYIDSVVVKLADSFGFANTNSVLCAGDTFSIPYFAARTYTPNNIFTAQLSDTSGSFSTPVDIGSSTVTGSSVMNCIIPPGTPTGSNYKIRLLASDIADTSTDYGFTIKIGNSVAKPTATSNSPICEDGTLQLTATCATPRASFYWTGPNGFTSHQPADSVTNALLANRGDYIATAYVHGCEAYDTTNVTIYSGDGPATIATSSNSPVCLEDTLRLFGNAINNNSVFMWTGPGGFFSENEDTIIANADQFRGGRYVLHSVNGNCEAHDTIMVVIKPVPQNLNATSNTPICNGADLKLSVSSSADTAIYTWSGPDNYTSTDTAISLPGISNTGNYYVTAELNGCFAYDTISVIIKPVPPKPVAGSNSPVCEGDSLVLTTTSNPGIAHNWTGPGNFSATVPTPTLTGSTADMSGDYIVTVDSNSCSNSDTTTIFVQPTMTAIDATDTIICATNSLHLAATNSSPGAVYTWEGPDLLGVDSQQITISNPTIGSAGWYYVSAALNGCLTADSTYVSIPKEELLLYPNPGRGRFVVEGFGCTRAAGTASFNIVNAAGQVVYNAQLEPTDGHARYELDLKHLSGGVYILRMETKFSRDVIPFAIQ